ncbi:hypothetical protein G3260_003395 [Streptomyces albus]|uniref:DUF6339 family protein n=1 Tax=Streptomyces albus TaxID=1888 RepID=UPI0013B49AC4|nr:DUF6339 family protein [Streptomyces albus]QID37063.1 hypothetical protein G3260_003395 [Streptomyces albus]
MSPDVLDLPERMLLLRDTVARKHLTRGVLSGSERLPLVALCRASEPVAGPSPRWEVRPLRELFDTARRLHEGRRTSADAWLAPRLHATLRLTRAEAAEPGLWNFLALAVAPDYVLWRHLPSEGSGKKEPAVSSDRFSGPHYKQAFARLWWAAELFRDGEDYEPAVSACRNQEFFNTLLRLEVIDHRPTARAATCLLEEGTVGTTREANALATAVNAAAGTHDPPVSPTVLPLGPADGPVPDSSVGTMVELLRELFEQAPVRGKEEPQEAQDGREPPARAS